MVFLMVLVSLFLITAKSSKRVSNYLFAAFLMVTAMDMTGLFILRLPNAILASLKISSVLLQMPLFYLYVQSVCYSNFKLGVKHLLHGVLFVLMFILLLAEVIPDQIYNLYQLISKIQYYGYILAVLLTLRQFKKLYQENYAADHAHTYKWLMQTTILFLIGNSFVTIRSYLSTGENKELLMGINVVISIFALLVICWFALKALYRPSLFLGVDKNIAPLLADKETKLHVSRYSPADMHAANKLSGYMDTEKPYLDPEISLQKLANGTSFTEKQLSQLINQQVGKHFFDYINEYRIRDAKVLLKEKPSLTVLEILYQVGFNSKSSFYTAFKKETSQTPTLYRKSMK